MGGLDAVLERTSPIFRPLGEAFKTNLASVFAVTTLPFHISAAHAHNVEWHRTLISHRILATADAYEAGTVVDEAVEQAIDRAAQATANGSLNERLASPDGANQLLHDSCAFLLEISNDDAVRSAAKEILRQGVVLLWSALEVIARDSFVTYLNRNPAKSVQILRSERTQKRFGLKTLPLQLVFTHGFDLSQVMGDVLAGTQDLSDIATIRDVYNELFPDASVLQQRLADNALYKLYKRRSLLVHRRGIVDRTYLSETDDEIELGTEMIVDPAYLRSSLTNVRDCGMSLLETVSASQ